MNKTNCHIIFSQPQQQFTIASELAKLKTSLEKRSAVGFAQIFGNEQIYFKNGEVNSFYHSENGKLSVLL